MNSYPASDVVRRTYPIKKHRGLAQNMTGLDKLLRALAQRRIALVHLGQPRLMLRKSDVQLVDCLRSTGSDGDERSRVVERSNRNNVLLLLDLGCEKANATRHFVDSSNFAHKRALEWVNIGIELVFGASVVVKVAARDN